MKVKSMMKSKSHATRALRNRIPHARAERRHAVEKNVAGDAHAVDQREHAPGRRFQFRDGARPTREPGQQRGEKWQADERMRDRAMVFHDSQVDRARRSSAKMSTSGKTAPSVAANIATRPLRLEKYPFAEERACDSGVTGSMKDVRDGKKCTRFGALMAISAVIAFSLNFEQDE